MIIFLTCAESDAVPFLLGLPRDVLERAILVTTKAPAKVFEDTNLGKSVWVITSVSSLGEIRRLSARAESPIAIVVGPDYGPPSYRKRFIRRRLLAPWVLPAGARADLVRIRAGGAVSGRWLRCSRAGLLLRMYPGQAVLLVCFAFLRVVGVPLGLFTFVRLLPALFLTEARARLFGGRRAS